MKSKLNVLYISTLCSERLISDMLNSKLGLPHLAAQKFHRLFVQGMALNTDLFNLNTLCVPEYNKSLNGERVIINNPESEAGVHYTYTPIVLLPIIKHIVTAFYLLSQIIKWRFGSNYKNNILAFDVLNINTSFVAIITSKLFRMQSVGIVTDIPNMLLVLKSKVRFEDKLLCRIDNMLLNATDRYIFLTEAMNSVVNKKRKPYCIIEGFSDSRLLSVTKIAETKNFTKVVHYSGGLYEKFGVKFLIDAFMLIDKADIKLHLFGDGDLINYINKCKEEDPRIVFFGYKDNNIVLDNQHMSFVLVNPRFTHEEYTKYSFPSKTIEYMSSGIPLLTTKLPGIPPEYFGFVYLFEKESVEGYCNSLKNVLEKSKDEMINFGKKAKKFVLENKSNKIQSQKFYNNFFDIT